MRRWLNQRDYDLLTQTRGSSLHFWHLLTLGKRYALVLVRENKPAKDESRKVVEPKYQGFDMR
jgi:hypothetical protein